MAVIINPRGAGGSGKTEFVRRIMRELGWRSGSHLQPPQTIEPLYRENRARPIGYALARPSGGPALVVLGHYEGTCGGCDTISNRDGGMEEVFRLARTYASSGSDVLMEGLCLSMEHSRSAALAQEHRLHVLRLSTPPGQCAANLISRRRGGAHAREALTHQALSLDSEIDRACNVLRSCSQVEVLRFEEAIGRAKGLLGLSARDATSGLRWPES